MPVARERGGAAPGGFPETELSKDEVFDVLANQRRRYALHYLLGNEDRCEVGELAEQIAAWENQTPVAEVTAAQRKRAYTALQQHHLPQMDEVGVIEYDQRSGIIEATEATEEFDIYLDVVEGWGIPWSQYYLGLSAVSLALMVGAWANMLPISDAACGLFVAVALTVSAMGHHYSREKLGTSGIPPEVERG